MVLDAFIPARSAIQNILVHKSFVAWLVLIIAFLFCVLEPSDATSSAHSAHLMLTKTHSVIAIGCHITEYDPRNRHLDLIERLCKNPARKTKDWSDLAVSCD